MRRRHRSFVPSPQVMPELPSIRLPTREYLAKLNAVKDQLTVAQFNEVIDNHYKWHEQNRGRKL